MGTSATREDMYIDKPVNDKDLKTTVNTILEIGANNLNRTSGKQGPLEIGPTLNSLSTV